MVKTHPTRPTGRRKLQKRIGLVPNCDDMELQAQGIEGGVSVKWLMWR